MVTNLDTDYIKYEIIGDSTYYGYAKPGTDTSKKEWSIRKVTGTGASVSVDWNLNQQFSYSAIWDDNSQYFGYDASQSISPTYSMTENTNSFGITRNFIDITWSEFPGTDYYRLKISDQNNKIYNHLHQENINPFIRDKYTAVTKETKYKFIGMPNMTYSVDFYLLNSTGQNQNGSLTIVT